jgi:hypothetical protein
LGFVTFGFGGAFGFGFAFGGAFGFGSAFRVTGFFAGPLPPNWDLSQRI